MQISAKTDYACRALVELATHWPSVTPVPISIISEHQEIPMKFLTHILLNLKQLGYVQSIRGKQGGYVLTQAPSTIRLSAVLSEFENLGTKSKENTSQKTKVMQEIWNEVTEKLIKNLETITFDKILERKKQLEKVVTFEI